MTLYILLFYAVLDDELDEVFDDDDVLGGAN
jgi:hypothetical protein